MPTSSGNPASQSVSCHWLPIGSSHRATVIQQIAATCSCHQKPIRTATAATVISSRSPPSHTQLELHEYTSAKVLSSSDDRRWTMDDSIIVHRHQNQQRISAGLYKCGPLSSPSTKVRTSSPSSRAATTSSVRSGDCVWTLSRALPGHLQCALMCAAR